MASSVSTTVYLDETALIECRHADEFSWIRLGDYPTTVELFLGRSDEEAANAADRLIEALNEARTAALARIVKSAA